MGPCMSSFVEGGKHSSRNGTVFSQVNEYENINEDFHNLQKIRLNFILTCATGWGGKFLEMLKPSIVHCYASCASVIVLVCMGGGGGLIHCFLRCWFLMALAFNRVKSN